MGVLGSFCAKAHCEKHARLKIKNDKKDLKLTAGIPTPKCGHDFKRGLAGANTKNHINLQERGTMSDFEKM